MCAKPIEIKLLRGTANSTRERRRGEIKFPGEHNTITPAPASLSAKSKKLWDSLTKQLAQWGLNYPTVKEYLLAYCQLYEMREEAIKHIDENGIYVIEGKTKRSPGIKRKSVQYKTYNELTKKMTLIGSKLGFSPADLAKLG